MKAGLISLALLASRSLTVCDDGAQSLECYKAHDNDRNVKVEECKKASDPRGTGDRAMTQPRLSEQAAGWVRSAQVIIRTGTRREAKNYPPPRWVAGIICGGASDTLLRHLIIVTRFKASQPCASSASGRSAGLYTTVHMVGE